MLPLSIWSSNQNSRVIPTIIGSCSWWCHIFWVCLSLTHYSWEWSAPFSDQSKNVSISIYTWWRSSKFPSPRANPTQNSLQVNLGERKIDQRPKTRIEKRKNKHLIKYEKLTCPWFITQRALCKKCRVLLGARYFINNWIETWKISKDNS